MADTKSDAPASSRVLRRRDLLAGCPLVLGAGALWLGLPGEAAAQEPTIKVALKGRVLGGQLLLNAVWNEAKDPKNHRYSFRVPSATVGKNAKILRAYLAKELCIVALSADKASPNSTPIPVRVSGGRTTPGTLVIPVGQNVQFENHDPFRHKLYSVGDASGALAPEEMKFKGQRVWKPPKAGTYEIRDKYFPSIRMWITVEPKAAAHAFPKATTPGEFVVPDLAPGLYELRGYFMGKAVGKPLEVDVRPTPELQQLRDPLIVAEKKKKDGDKDDDKKPDEKK
jgi:hypothetical protein